MAEKGRPQKAFYADTPPIPLEKVTALDCLRNDIFYYRKVYHIPRLKTRYLIA
jgi:hypothetical protein